MTGKGHRLSTLGLGGLIAFYSIPTYGILAFTALPISFFFATLPDDIERLPKLLLFRKRKLSLGNWTSLAALTTIIILSLLETKNGWIWLIWACLSILAFILIFSHRTLTHWWPIYLIPALIALYYYQESFVAFLVFTISLSAMSHILTDWPNPTGVPNINPWGKRTSLNLWKSGEKEPLIISMFWLIGGFPWIF